MIRRRAVASDSNNPIQIILHLKGPILDKLPFTNIF